MACLSRGASFVWLYLLPAALGLLCRGRSWLPAPLQNNLARLLHGLLPRRLVTTLFHSPSRGRAGFHRRIDRRELHCRGGWRRLGRGLAGVASIRSGKQGIAGDGLMLRGMPGFRLHRGAGHCLGNLRRSVFGGNQPMISSDQFGQRLAVFSDSRFHRTGEGSLNGFILATVNQVRPRPAAALVAGDGLSAGHLRLRRGF
jgi:hypothetical protein